MAFWEEGEKVHLLDSLMHVNRDAELWGKTSLLLVVSWYGKAE